MAVRITTDTGAREPRADLRMLTRSGQHQLAVTNDPNGIRLTLGGAPASSLQWTRAGEITLVLPPTSREQ